MITQLKNEVKMIIPMECIKWIRLQRTDCKDPVNNFKDEIQKEYLEMREYLPKDVDSILDIGCGLGGIDILLSKHYNKPELYLMDNSEISGKLKYGYDRGKEYYSSFAATELLMKANYIKNYNLIDIKSKSLPMFEKIDLVISLLSCGYHYPVTEYLGYVKTILAKSGALIIDIRENTDGIDIVKKLFPKIKEISYNNKSIRICAGIYEKN